jgi:hypothetical protein
VGRAFQLDGVDDHVGDIGQTGSYAFMQNTGVFTIDAWIQIDNPNALTEQAITANTATSAERRGSSGAASRIERRRRAPMLVGSIASSCPAWRGWPPSPSPRAGDAPVRRRRRTRAPRWIELTPREAPRTAR